MQTLYLAWGSKRALLRAYMDAALASVRDASDDDMRPTPRSDTLVPADRDPQAAIQGMTHLHRQVAERVAAGWQLYRDASATNPAIAADWQQLQRLRRRPFQTLIQSLPPAALRPDLTVADAADTAWAIASPDTYEVLVRHGGYSLDDYETWVTRTLTAALLAPDRND